jgi:hypothetical protein
MSRAVVVVSKSHVAAGFWAAKKREQHKRENGAGATASRFKCERTMRYVR